jgi:hypothetical protein
MKVTLYPLIFLMLTALQIDCSMEAKAIWEIEQSFVCMEIPADCLDSDTIDEYMLCENRAPKNAHDKKLFFYACQNFLECRRLGGTWQPPELAKDGMTIISYQASV